jgi:hypothetical protein
MIKVVFLAVVLVFFIGIIKSTGVNRLCWFILGFLFCSSNIVILSNPYVPAHRLLVFGLLLSELIRYESFVKSWRNFPLKSSLIVFSVLILAVGLFDQRLSIFLKFYRPFYNIIESFFIVFLCYNSIKSELDLKVLLKIILLSSVVMTLFGFYNYITISNPYDGLISKAFDVVSSFDVYKLRVSEGDRFRINSFTAHPITYGFVVAMLLLIFLADISNNLIKNKKTFILVSLLLFVNLLMTNSRTPLVAFIAGLLLFIILKFDLRKKIKYFLISFFFGFLFYSTIPFVQDKVDSVIDIAVTGGEKEEGSNVEMRMVQLAASYTYFIQSPIYGNGFGFIQEDLGWGSSEDRVYDSDLRGFESWFFVLLIESGILGIIANLLLVIGLVMYFLRNLKKTRLYSSLGLSITVMFVVFSLSTGNLGSWMISMTGLGILIKLIELQRINICPIK